MPRLMLLIGLATLLSLACDSSRPRTTLPFAPSGAVATPIPQPTPQPTPQPAPLVTYTVSGVVKDGDGAAVPDVAVRSAAERTTSDAGGFYTLEIQRRQRYTGIVLSKSGFEDSAHPINLIANGVTRADLTLHRVLVINAGDSINLELKQEDPVCGFEDEWLCRRIRIRAGAPGTLIAEVTPLAGSIEVALTVGQIRYPFQQPTRITQPVNSASQEVAVDVLVWWGFPGRTAVRLATTLQPQ